MGVIAITMFLGISWLAMHIPGRWRATSVRSPGRSRIAVFGGGFGFYVVQFFTAAILILAANTAYQDFPRLSSILARDRYMPSQFMNRGDRLVFSNGILVLAVVSSVLIYAFDADLTRLIQLYVIGVFTSFTLSQSGMVSMVARRVLDHPPPLASVVINVTGPSRRPGAWLVSKFTGVPFQASGGDWIRRHTVPTRREGTGDVGATNGARR